MESDMIRLSLLLCIKWHILFFLAYTRQHGFEYFFLVVEYYLVHWATGVSDINDKWGKVKEAVFGGKVKRITVFDLDLDLITNCKKHLQETRFYIWGKDTKDNMQAYKIIWLPDFWANQSCVEFLLMNMDIDNFIT